MAYLHTTRTYNKKFQTHKQREESKDPYINIPVY